LLIAVTYIVKYSSKYKNIQIQFELNLFYLYIEIGINKLKRNDIMVSMNFLIIIAVSIIIVVLIVKLLKNCPASPDPWENEICKDKVDKLKHEICLNCGNEVKDGQYYCPKCNNATGKYVPYLPFVNIQFNYSMHQNLWSKLKSKDVSFVYKLIVILFIIFTAPIMIVVYLALVLLKGIKAIYRWIKKL